jgi:hypothetical protein
VHQRPFCEQQLARVAVGAVLLVAVLNRLAGELVLKLCGGNGDVVDEQGEVELVGCLGGIPELGGSAQPPASRSASMAASNDASS